MDPNRRRCPPKVSPPGEAAEIEAAAAAWFVRRQGGLDAGEEARFQDWLSTNPRCGAALAAYEKTWSVMSYPARAGLGSEARRQLQAHRRGRQRRGFVVGCLGLAAAAALVLAFLPPGSPAPDPSLRPVTVASRPDKQVLPDGSIVERNARADLTVDYTAGERRIRLIQGEALFTVAHDVSRPFLVVAGGVEVRAVGTEFSVRYETRQVNVLVTEGQVAVAKIVAAAPEDTKDPSIPAASAVAEPVYVAAGRRVVMPDNHLLSAAPASEPVTAAEMAAALAWRGKRLEFTRTSLLHVAELFNQQNRLQLAIDDRLTGEIQITGLFWADDPDGFARLLESGFNVRAERAGDVIRLRADH